MFKIVVTCDRGEEYGVLTRETPDGDTCVISRQIGKPALFASMDDAVRERKKWHRNSQCNHFGFEIVEVF